MCGGSARAALLILVPPEAVSCLATQGEDLPAMHSQNRPEASNPVDHPWPR